MTAPEQRRRPIPALILLLALCVLAGLVWYHVLSRADGTTTASSPGCGSSSATSTASDVPKGTPSTSSSRPVPGSVLPGPADVSLVVANATARNGLAGEVAGVLQTRGFRVTAAVNDAKSYGGHGRLHGVGEIRYRPAQREAAVLLHFYLPGATLTRLPHKAKVLGEVVVALGRKFRIVATNATVRRRLAARDLTIASPTPAPAPSSTC